MILLSEHIYDFDLDAALREIPEQRRVHALKYKFELDRRLSIKAYLMLCKGIKSLYGIDEMPEFHYDHRGKPFLANYPNIHFNISHCNEAVICAIDNHPIGVDIESIRAYDEELVQYTMNPDEQKQIRRAKHPEIEFTSLWTMKEAVLKRSGEGISNNLHEVLTDCKWRLSTIISPNQNYVYTICK